ncbi:MAG: hypothetical protein NTW49_13510 [Bacteroidia bacterium]|nr:hypothetical protein [Bacteroidia bacterium]
MKNSFIILFFILLILFSSCTKIEHYSAVPKLSYKSFSYLDSSLTFSVVDGDGDIGLNSWDTTGPFSRDSAYYYNLFMKLYQKKDSGLQLVPLPIPLDYRVPYIEKYNTNVYKADINIDLSVLNPFPYDTFIYEFYMVDRSLNKSNVVRTPLLSFKK